MARKVKENEMPSDQSNASEGVALNANGTPRKRRAPQGPRKVNPLYAFVRIDEGGKPQLAASFKDPRKMAEYFPTATTNGESLLIIAPE